MSDSSRRSRIQRRIPRAATHVGSVLTSNLVNRVTSFVVYAIVARELGIDAFASLALATSVFLIAGRVVGLGIQPVVVRRVARDPVTANRLLSSSIPAIFTAWLVGWAVIELFLAVTGYSNQTDTVIRVMYLAAFGFGVGQTCEGFLIATDPHRLPRITVPIWVGQTLVAAGVIYVADAGVVVVATTIAIAHLVIGIVSVVVVARLHEGPLGWTGTGPVWDLTRESSTFLAANAANTLASSGILVVISAVGSDLEVALYAAAQQLFTPVALLSEATASTLYPRIVRRLGGDRDPSRFVTMCSEVVFGAVVPAAVGLVLVAEPTLVVVFGDQVYAAAAVVIRILAISVVFRGLSLLFGQVMYAGDDEMTSLVYAIVRAITILGSSAVLTAVFGIVGAAFAGATASLLNFVLHHLRVRRQVSGVDLVHAMVPSLVGSAAMALVVAVLLGATPLAVPVLVGAAVYAVVVGVLYRSTDRLPALT